MSPRDTINIATAALRWATAYDRRRAATAEKRRADALYRALSPRSPDYWAISSRSSAADKAVTEARRQERKAATALSAACSAARNDLRGAEQPDIYDAEPGTVRFIEHNPTKDPA